MRKKKYETAIQFKRIERDLIKFSDGINEFKSLLWVHE